MSVKKKKKQTVLHTRVLEVLNAIQVKSKAQRDKMIHLLHRLYISSKVAGKYSNVPSTYWQKAIAEHYERTLTPMKDFELIQSTNSYSNFEGNKFCKSYRINPKYLNDEVTVVEFEVTKKHGKTKKKTIPVVVKHTKRMLRLIKLDVRAAKTELNRYLNEDRFKEKLRVDHEIPDSWYVETDTTGLPYFFGKRICHMAGIVREIANERGYSLIKDKKEYFIDKPEHYYELKKFHIRQSYNYCIAMFQNRSVYAKRNKTNHRLDSNLTSFPSLLLPHLSLGGETLISIDLSNSQFSILADLIMKGHFQKELHQISNSVKSFTQVYPFMNESNSSNSFTGHFIQYINDTLTHQPVAAFMSANSAMVAQPKTKYGAFLDSLGGFPADLLHFIELAKSGKIYGYIKEKLNLKNVADAKQFAFEMFFAKYKYQGPGKLQLKKIFPTLISIIDAYKKNNGDNEFAILLQKRESYIFIDRILHHLANKGYKVLSKHDSILCVASKLKDVEMEVRTILDEELGDYRLKITDANGIPITSSDKIAAENPSVGIPASLYISMQADNSYYKFDQGLYLWLDDLQGRSFKASH